MTDERRRRHDCVKKWKQRLDNTIYNGIIIFLIAFFSFGLSLINLRDGNDKRFMVEYGYELPTVTISIWLLVEVSLNFSIRGCKEVWAERPIMYYEAFISLLYWTTAIVEFVISTDNTVESQFVGMNTVFWMRNLRALEFMAEL